MIQNITVNLHQSLKIECDIPEAFIRGNIKWYRLQSIENNQSELKELSEKNIYTDDQGNLFFYYTELEDDSFFQSNNSPYMCIYDDVVFENKLNGSKIYLRVVDTNIKLEYPPVPLKISEKTILANNNDNPRIDCLHGGYPIPNVTWFLNDTEIKEYENSFGGYIFYLQFIHSGLWSCKVTNGVGPGLEHSFTMVVKQGLYFTQIQNSIEKRRGLNAQFNCLAMGDSILLKYEWFYNNQNIETLSLNERWTVTPNSIIITNVEAEDMGVFACRVTSNGSEIYDENYLMVY